MNRTWILVLLLYGILEIRGAPVSFLGNLNCFFYQKNIEYLFFFKQIIAEYSKVECINFVPSLVQLNCGVTWISKNKSALNMNFTFTEDVGDLYGEMNLVFQFGKHIVNYTSFEVDFCTILQSVHTTRLIQSIAVELRRVSNLPMKCPFKMVSLEK